MAKKMKLIHAIKIGIIGGAPEGSIKVDVDITNKCREKNSNGVCISRRVVFYKSTLQLLTKEEIDILRASIKEALRVYGKSVKIKYELAFLVVDAPFTVGPGDISLWIDMSIKKG